jgi:hypothetical protein
MRFRTITEYYVHVKSKVARSGYSNDWNALKVKAESKTQGVVQAVAFQFIDGATLRFFEELELDDDGIVHQPGYLYHYECLENRNQFFFRYDRDPVHVVPFSHEEYHLHVNRKEPRFKTHATSFEEVFDFIIACFYEMKQKSG